MMEAQIDRVDAVSGVRTPWKTIKPSDTVGLAAINQVVITPGREPTVTDICGAFPICF